MEKRIIALDIGDRRVGIAISDPFNGYAMPVDTYWRTKSFETDVAAILKIITERDAGTIVCGLPVHADGTESEQTEKAKYFIQGLQERTNIPIVTEDERFTSIEAHQTLRNGGVKSKNHKKNVDSVAASFILESYLLKRKRAGNEIK